LRAGADDYLLKPCEPTELLSCVAKAVHRRQEQQRQVDAIQTIFIGLDQLRGGTQPLVPEPAQAPSVEEPGRYLHVGQLTIDCFRHTATFNGQTLHLTPIEYALLLCLAEARGRVVGYSEIIRRTHGISVDEMEAQTLIKPHIRNLRRKIDPAYLSNVRGTGYVLAAPLPTA
jgi:DNA-binding response OmpR family regulator